MSDNGEQSLLDDSLKEEYLYLQKTVEDFDQRVITIKAWSVTFSMAAVGFAFSQKSPLILLLAGASAIIFWSIETLWKMFQNAYYPRIYEIESYFRGDKTNVSPYQISTSWLASFRSTKWTRFLDIAFWPHVALPHLLVALGGLALFFLNSHYKFIK
jgi:hypothetical protein